ncbi:hypothetical protein CRM22_006837, partial [Opisthorchis felineus]
MMTRVTYVLQRKSSWVQSSDSALIQTHDYKRSPDMASQNQIFWRQSVSNG